MTDRLDVSSLRQVAVFRELDDAALAELSAAAQVRVYAKRMQIAGDAPASACLVAEGAVRLYRVSTMGRETTLLTRREGDLFGFLPDTADGEPRTFAEALVDHTVVHHLPRSRVLQLVVAHPDSARVAIDHLLRLLADTFDRLEELTCADVKVRLAHTLARLAASDEGHVVWETHETLAWLIGASREKVTKEVCCLRQQGLVTYPSHHHGIRINDLDHLSSM